MPSLVSGSCWPQKGLTTLTAFWTRHRARLASQVWHFIISWISLDFISMWFLIADLEVWVLSVKSRLQTARFLSFSFLSISFLYWTTFRWVHVATGEVS